MNTFDSTATVSKLYVGVVTASILVSVNGTPMTVNNVDIDNASLQNVIASTSLQSSEDALGGVMTFNQYNELADLADDFFSKF